MFRSTTPAITAAAALLLAPLPVLASGGGTAGVLPMKVEGQLPPNGPEELDAKIAEGLQGAGATVLSTGELEGAAGGSLAGCADEACLADAASKAGASHLVRTSVKFDGSDYAMTIEVIEGASGKVLHSVSDTCELCGLSEAADKFGALAGSLTDALAAPSGGAMVTITSEPPGATVMVDGQVVGVTPLEIELVSGEHDVTVSKDGYYERESLLRLDAGDVQTLDLELDPSGPGKNRPKSAAWGKIRPVLPWVSLGVGAAALASGIALIAIDNKPVEFTRCDGPDVDADGDCRFRNNTIVGGALMTIVGIGGLAAGTVLLVLDKRHAKDDDRSVRIRPTRNGLALHF